VQNTSARRLAFADGTALLVGKIDIVLARFQIISQLVSPRQRGLDEDR
jgi:hypothetical protein